MEKSWIELLGSPQADGIQNDSQTQTHITKGNSHEKIHIQSLLENQRKESPSDYALASDTKHRQEQ